MFYQTLDNPLQFCSHGFDHSILVDEYVKNISEGTDVVNKTMKKYGISKDAATTLLRLTAVFHDFGYPRVGNLDKSTHGPFG
jgi:HD superfamily phosphodiesterase